MFENLPDHSLVLNLPKKTIAQNSSCGDQSGDGYGKRHGPFTAIRFPAHTDSYVRPATSGRALRFLQGGGFRVPAVMVNATSAFRRRLWGFWVGVH